MDCTVIIEGPRGPFGRTSPRVEVAVADVKMQIISDMERVIAAAVHQGLTAFAATLPVPPEPAEVPDDFTLISTATLEGFQHVGRCYAPWLAWSEAGVYTPGMLGTLESLFGGISHAIGMVDSTDWIGQDADASQRTLFDVLTARTSEVVGELLRHVSPENIDVANARLGTDLPGGTT